MSPLRCLIAKMWIRDVTNSSKLKDSLQAFSSSIAGLLSSRAVLQGNTP